MTTTRRAALTALLAMPLAAVASRKSVGSEPRELMQLQQSEPPYTNASEAAAGLPVLDDATLMLLEYARRSGGLDAAQMMRDLKQHAAEAWSSYRLVRMHGGPSRGFVADVAALDGSLNQALGHRDFETRDGAASTWMALVEQREARLRSANRFLLPEARSALLDFDSDRGGFAMRPALHYNLGAGDTVGRLFLPLEPTGHLYSALDLPALRLPGGEPGRGLEVYLPVAGQAHARAILSRRDLRVFYELSLRPGIRIRLRGDPRRMHINTPVLSVLSADLHAVVICDGRGDVLAYATMVRAVRL